MPVPGGACDEGMAVTSVENLRNTIDAFKKAFFEAGARGAWDNVMAIVVQPGVEFSGHDLHEYDREAARALCDALHDYPELVFEGHSTDYQTKYKLREMVEDGVAILKVGPALTFALREALFGLNMIENELLAKTDIYLSNFTNLLETEMLADPKYWENHYFGNLDTLSLQRKYSLFDRARYYLPKNKIKKSIERLLGNLEGIDIPLSLLSQYFPIQYKRIREKTLQNNAKDILLDRIQQYLDDYNYAVGKNQEY